MTHVFRQSILLVVSFAIAGFAGAAGPRQADLSAHLFSQFEEKWAPLMRNVFGMDDAAMARFREEHALVPAAEMQRALAATTWDEAKKELDSARAMRAAGPWPNAIDLQRLRPEDAANPQLAAAYKLFIMKPVPPGWPPKRFHFVATAPCTVFDTRYATDPGAAGIIGDGVTRLFNVFGSMAASGWNFSTQGGNIYCPNPYLGGETPHGVMMTVYVSDATANGWLTFYQQGLSDPSQSTISVYYSPGPTRTQTVVSRLGRPIYIGFTHDVAVTGRYGSAHASASVTGYFVPMSPEPLECTAGTPVSQAVSTAGSTAYTVNASTCPTDYRIVSSTCSATGDASSGNLTMSGSGVSSGGVGTCSGWHVGTAPVTVTNTPWCCRVKGDY